MGKLERQQKQREFLQKIDSALQDNAMVLEPVGSLLSQSTGEKKYAYVSQQEVKVLGEDIYNYGTGVEKGKMTALKNAASNLVLIESPGKEFPGSETFRINFKTLQKRHKDFTAMVQKDPTMIRFNNMTAINSDYRTFRDKALSHVISTPEENIPEWLRGVSGKIGELYSALDEDYRSRKMESDSEV